MILIPLTKGQQAVVDEADRELVESCWHALYSKTGKCYYAMRTIKRDGRRCSYRMHVAVMESTLGRRLRPGELVDHVNGLTLDNRRHNLRIATKSQNAHNSRKPVSNRSGYKGVCWQSAKRLWRATIKANGKQYHLGYFTDVLKAAQAYDLAAAELCGEFARSNGALH